MDGSNRGRIAEQVACITQSIETACRSAGKTPDEVRLMAVTKTVEAARVNEAISAGVRLLGENRAQELLAKYDDYQKEQVEIHFIGHLQTNKVRQIIDQVDMVQSLDRISLAEELSRQCERIGRRIDCLVEVNIGNEASKAGVSIEQLPEFLEQLSGVSHLRVRGLMSIPPVLGEPLEQERYFSSLYKLFVDIGQKKIDNICMDFLSMGMSDDYLLAIKHGSNLVRIGSALFGRRGYP